MRLVQWFSFIEPHQMVNIILKNFLKQASFFLRSGTQNLSFSKNEQKESVVILTGWEVRRIKTPNRLEPGYFGITVQCFTTWAITVDMSASQRLLQLKYLQWKTFVTSIKVSKSIIRSASYIDQKAARSVWVRYLLICSKRIFWLRILSIGFFFLGSCWDNNSY